MTANAFVVSTRKNIEAAKFLLSEKGFKYILPAVWADEILEFWYSGNFYIDIVEVTSAANVLNLHNLLKNGISDGQRNASINIYHPMELGNKNTTFTNFPSD